LIKLEVPRRLQERSGCVEEKLALPDVASHLAPLAWPVWALILSEETPGLRRTRRKSCSQTVAEKPEASVPAVATRNPPIELNPSTTGIGSSAAHWCNREFDADHFSQSYRLIQPARTASRETEFRAQRLWAKQVAH
jgi:hypothetical protein